MLNKATLCDIITLTHNNVSSTYGAEEHCKQQAVRQAVGHQSPKGGDACAYYSDMACVWLYLHIDNKEKKQQPPLGQVTVVEVEP